jgi:hypothetical protein
VIINRRSLLAAIGLTFPALAGAEAATTKKKKTPPLKPKAPAHTHKVAARKPHHSAKPAPTKS